MKLFLKILKWIGIVIAGIAAAVVIFFVFLTIFEFRPAQMENVHSKGSASKIVKTGAPMKIITWNVGCGALGDNADFFMDGGKMVTSATKSRVNENLQGISDFISSENPDFIFLQELDRDAHRSHHVDEVAFFIEKYPEMQTVFAINYKVFFVPFPVPPIGQVEAGIMTLSSANSTESTRIQLPCPFKYPVRLGNLKRCLLVTRIPVADSEHDLVLVNLHLEAYDSGEGKIAQTKMLHDIFDHEAEKGNYVIAGGDFNQSFSTADLSNYPFLEGMWKPGFIDVNDFDEGIQFEMYDKEPSCRSLDKPYIGADKSNFQYYVIDGFLVSSNITVNSLETKNLDFVNSDHNPVEMIFTLE